MSSWSLDPWSPPSQNVDSTDKRVTRTTTPSTVCDENEEVLLNWELDVLPGSRTASNVVSSSGNDASTRKRSRGLTPDQFLSAVRSPFLFPATHTGTRTSAVPVCIICQNSLKGGDLCRELVNCGHCFHSDCVEDYFLGHSRCPVCRSRCRPPSSVRGRAKRLAHRQRPRPCWTPEYDSELLSVSDRVDRERRARVYLTKGIRDEAPQSHVFLKSSLPVVLEECADELGRDDGSLLSLCRFLNREKEKRILSSMKNWNRDMQKLAVAFVLSVVVMYLNQKQYVETYLNMCLEAPKKESIS